MNIPEGQIWRLSSPEKSEQHNKINIPTKQPGKRKTLKHEIDSIKKCDLENVFERSSGELGGNALIPRAGFLEGNIRCGGYQVGAHCNRRVRPWCVDRRLQQRRSLQQYRGSHSFYAVEACCFNVRFVCENRRRKKWMAFVFWRF